MEKVRVSEWQSNYKICQEKKNWEKYSTENRLIQKCLHLENGIEYFLKSYEKSFDKMIKALHELDHPNVIQVHEILEGRDCIVIVFQNFDGVTLSDELHSLENRKLSDRDAFELVSQIISASRYLLRHKYLRHYPSLENILLRKTSCGYYLQVADLFSPTLCAGSALFPEDTKMEKYTLFNIGLITFSIVSGIRPIFSKGAECEVINSILNSEEYLNLTSSCRDFISTCFSSLNLTHVNIETIQRHPWLHFGDRFNKPIAPSSFSLLTQYPMKSLLSRLLRLSLSNSLSTINIDNILSEFLTFDSQGFGEIEYYDFIRSFQNVSETVVRKIFCDINVNRTGCISYHEFIAATMKDGDVTENQLRNAFRQLCRPNQTTIRMADIECRLGDSYSNIDITKMYSEVGLTITSTINFDQFLKLVGFNCDGTSMTATTTTTTSDHNTTSSTIQPSRSPSLMNTNDNSTATSRTSSSRELLGVMATVEETERLLRRKGQSLTENIVAENIHTDLTSLYFMDANAILGSGISGHVIKCRHRISGVQYALKTLEKRNLSAKKISLMRQEINMMARLDHPHILRLHEWFETEDNVYLILNLCTGGELLDNLNEQPNHRYSEEVACKLVHDILGAVRYCHDHKIAHRDLKLENFLFENQSDNATIKLIDFGLSCYFSSSHFMTECIGTPYYVAPEVLGKQYDEKCDMWSIGVIAYMLLTGTPIFNGNDDSEILKLVARGKVEFNSVFDNISAAGRDFVRRCLVKNPVRRISAQDAQKHIWFCHLSQHPKAIPPQILRNLQAFSLRSPLSRLFHFVLAHTQKSENLIEIRNVFCDINTSKSGELTNQELQRALLEQHIFNVNDTEWLFSNLDIERIGKIRYHQFIAAALTSSDVKERRWKLAFQLLSHNKEYITTSDIRDILGLSATEQIMKELLSNYPDQNLRLSFADFQNIINNKEVMSEPKVNSSSNGNSNSNRIIDDFSNNDMITRTTSTESQDVPITRSSKKFPSQFKKRAALIDDSNMNGLTSSQPTVSLPPIVECNEEKSYSRNYNTTPTPLFSFKVASSTTGSNIPTGSPCTPTTVAIDSFPSQSESPTIQSSQGNRHNNRSGSGSGARSNKSNRGGGGEVKMISILQTESSKWDGQSPGSNNNTYHNTSSSSPSSSSSKQSLNGTPINSSSPTKSHHHHHQYNVKTTNEAIPSPMFPVAFPPRKGSLQNRQRPSPKMLTRQLSSHA